jgi:hypothetical protein
MPGLFITLEWHDTDARTGTQYLAPEIILNKAHSVAVDWCVSQRFSSQSCAKVPDDVFLQVGHRRADLRNACRIPGAYLYSAELTQ